MTSDDGFRKYIEAGAVLGQVTRARAEEIVKELVNAGDLQREQAQQWVDDLLDRSRKTSEELVRLVRTEITNQLSAFGIDPEDLARHLSDTIRHSADVGRSATKKATRSVSGRAGETTKKAKKTAPGKKAGAKKAGAKKAAAKKTSTNKASAKKAPAKKASAKKAARKSTASSRRD